MLTVADRAEIAEALKSGWSTRAIAGHIDRSPSVVSREVRRNSTAPGKVYVGYLGVHLVNSKSDR